MPRKSEIEKNKAAENLLVSLQMTLNAIDQAEVTSLYMHKVKHHSNQLKQLIEGVFNNAFKNIDTDTAEYYVNMINFLSYQTEQYHKIARLPEVDQKRIIYALENFYKTNIK